MDSRARLEQLTIATPCEMRWEDMPGDARIRHCGACRLSVHNLGELTTLEVDALLQSSERVCARLYRRPDGTVVTGDCRRIWREQRKEAVPLLGKTGTVVAALSFLVVVGFLTLILLGDIIRLKLGMASTGTLDLSPSPPAPTSPVPNPFGQANHY